MLQFGPSSNHYTWVGYGNRRVCYPEHVLYVLDMVVTLFLRVSVCVCFQLITN